MVKEIYLDDTLIPLTFFKDQTENGLHKIYIEFDVTSEDYHDIATLLYREQFDIDIPEIDTEFRGKIFNYATSLTNLYESEQVAQYNLVLIEIPKDTKD